MKIKKIIFICFLLLLYQNNLFSNSKKYLKNLIATYLTERDYDRALAVCSNYIKLYPDDCEGYKIKGMIYEAENIYLKALQSYIEGINKIKCKKLNYNAGLLLFKMGKYKKSLYFLFNLFNKNKFIGYSLDKYKIYKTIGKNFFFLNNYQSAIEYFEKCMQINFRDVEIYDFLKNAYENLNMINFSHSYFEIGNLLRDDNNIDSYTFYFDTAVIFLKYKIYSKSIDYFLKASKKYKNNYIYNLDIGLTYLLQKKYDDAIYHLRKCIEIYNKKFNIKKSIKRLLKLDRKCAKYHLILSAAYYLNGDTKKAKKEYLKVKKYNVAVYKIYTFDLITTPHSKFYKELPEMWEHRYKIKKK